MSLTGCDVWYVHLRILDNITSDKALREEREGCFKKNVERLRDGRKKQHRPHGGQ